MPAAAQNRTSPARIEANRRNAQKSTGPRTEAGKARSRSNAVKHGLTGAGLVLAVDDRAAVEAEFLRVQEDWAPGTLAGMKLAHRVALLGVRADRAARQEAAQHRMQLRRAGTDFDAARLARADALIDAIEADPRGSRRGLLALPEGVDRLVAALGDLRLDLTGPAPGWSRGHHRRLDALFGYRVADLPWNRPTRFSRLLLGEDDAVGPADEAPEDGLERTAWTIDRLIDAIDAEVAALAAHRATLDLAAIAEDRRDAAECVLRDTSREAELGRRYEVTAYRELSRALRDLRLAESLAAPEPDEVEPDAVEPGEATPEAPAARPEPVRAGAPEVGEAGSVAPAPPAPEPERPDSPTAAEPTGGKPSAVNEIGTPLGSFCATSAAAPAMPPASPIRVVHTAEAMPHAVPVGR